jgi:hypothetical protein
MSLRSRATRRIGAINELSTRYLFDDEEGEADLARIDAKMGKLPGWGRRLIENEEWAVRPPRFQPVAELTTRRSARQGIAGLEPEGVPAE